MGAVAAILPLIIQALALVPTLTSTAQDVIDGVEKIWSGVTAEEDPTPEQMAQYQAALDAARAQFEKDAAPRP